MAKRRTEPRKRIIPRVRREDPAVLAAIAINTLFLAQIDGEAQEVPAHPLLFRHLTARIAFMEKLLEHERVTSLWRHLEKLAGLNNRERLIEREMAHLHRELVVKDHPELRPGDEVNIVGLSPDAVEMSRGIARWRAAERAVSFIGGVAMPQILGAASSLVRDELNVPWPWAVYDLVSAFIRSAFEISGNTIAYRLDRAVAEPRTASDLKLPRGVPMSQAVEWLEQKKRELTRAPVNGKAKDPRMPRKRGESLKRGAEWAFRKLVFGENAYEIAKGQHVSAAHPGSFASCQCHDQPYKGIRRDLREAETALSLGGKWAKATVYRGR